MIKKEYEAPSLNVEVVRVEKGFAVSNTGVEQGTEQMDETYFEDGWE